MIAPAATPDIAAIIAEIQRLHELATPGPWKADQGDYGGDYIWGPNMEMVADRDESVPGSVLRMRGTGGNLPEQINRDLICALRNAAPALLAAAQRGIAPASGEVVECEDAMNELEQNLRASGFMSDTKTMNKARSLILRLSSQASAAEAQVKAIRGSEHPGPSERCGDCMRIMVWQRSDIDGHYPGSWMCPSCVHDRMTKAESVSAQSSPPAVAAAPAVPVMPECVYELVLAAKIYGPESRKAAAEAVESYYAAPAAPVMPEAVKRPKIVCLCGSTRFMKQFFDEGWRETLEGKIVLSVGVVTTGPKDHAGEAFGVKEALDELHKRKIDLADDVLVLNVGGYIGESTRSEIEYAIAHGKPVRYLESIAPPASPAKETKS